MRILIITIGSMGDLLILTPALRAIKSTYPKSVVTVVAAHYRYYTKKLNEERGIINYNAYGGVIEVLKNNPFVDKIIEIDRGRLRMQKGFKRLKTEWKIVRFLRKNKFDLVISTRNVDRFVLWAYISGAMIRIGQKQKIFGRLLTHALDIDIEDTNVLQYFNRLAESAGAKIESQATEYFIPAEAQKWADGLIKKYKTKNATRLIAIHPGATHPSRIWLPENFAKLSDEMQSRKNIKVLLCGSQFDREIIEDIKKYLTIPVVDVDEGEGDINKLAAIFERCDLCITNDSGPRHLAVAVGSRSLAIVVKSKFNAWKIYDDSKKMVVLPEYEFCSECRTGRCLELVPEGEKYGTLCIRSVSVPEVLSKIDWMLED